MELKAQELLHCRDFTKPHKTTEAQSKAPASMPRASVATVKLTKNYGINCHGKPIVSYQICWFSGHKLCAS